LWCQYYSRKFGVDVRSIRYPGLIGYRSPPGGGTTDYAVDIFHKAILNQNYECYLKENTPLPMIYTDDAIEGTVKIMLAPSESIKVRTSYNMHAMSFTPKQIF
jgi:nucleoside-diphosphate-sugar epimerase